MTFMRGCALLLGLAGPLQAQQTAPLVLRVVQGSARTVVPNAEILRLGTPTSRLTDARGELRLDWDGTTPLALRVRQIGFAPLDTILRSRTADGLVVLALRPLAYRLPEITAAAADGCPVDPSPIGRERAAIILEQLRIGAGHLEAFRREYRFTVVTRVSTAPIAGGRSDRRPEAYDESISSDNWRDTYRPGGVLSYDGRDEFNALLLFMSSLAADRFWSTHCFRALETDPAERYPTVRLAFSPKPNVRKADWSGVAILDSASAELLRLEFRLENLRKHEAPARLEGYTNFLRVSPYVMMPRETGAVWWLRAPRDSTEAWPVADLAQRRATRAIRWEGKRPPGTDSVTVIATPEQLFPDSLP